MKTLNEISALLLTTRKALELEQSDMYMRIGMKQQQYQRAETGHDMRLSSLLRILEGLDLELVLQPRNQLETSVHNQENLKDSEEDIQFWFNSDQNK